MSIAREMLDLHRKMDGLPKLPYPSNSFADDQALLVSDAADWIQRIDSGLGRRIVALKIGWADKKRVCELYARLVIGHEDDPNCDQILTELKRVSARLKLPGTCR
jgi:hypothetical protein